MIEMSSKNNVFRKGMTPIAPPPSVQHMNWVFTHGSYVGRYEAQVLSPPIQKNDPEERRERSCPASQAGVVQDESSASARIAKKQVHALVVQVIQTNSVAGLAVEKWKPNEELRHLKSLAGGSLVSWCEPGCSRKETNRAHRDSGTATVPGVFG